VLKPFNLIPLPSGILPEPWLPVLDLETDPNLQFSNSSPILRRNDSLTSASQTSEDPTSTTGPVVLSLRLRKSSLLRKPSLKGLQRSISNSKNQVGSSVSTSSLLNSNSNREASTSASKTPIEITVVKEDEEEQVGLKIGDGEELEQTEEEEEEEEGVYIHRSSTSQFFTLTQ